MEVLFQSAGERSGASSSAQQHANMTLRELCDAYMAAYAGRDKTRAHRLAWFCARLGSVPVRELTDDHIFAVMEDLATRPGRYWAGTDEHGRPVMRFKRQALAGATLNRYVNAIGGVFTWAIKKRLVPRAWEHPCRRLERHPEGAGRVRFLTAEERERLLAAARRSRWPRLYLLVLMALTTGARKGELMGLRWRDIDLEAHVAHVGRTKNGDARVLPLVPAVVAELARFRGGPEALLFASSRRPEQPYNMVPVWQRALEEAGVRDFRFHDLRHTCASYLAQNGATLLEIGEVLGHRQVSVTKRYSHLTVGHKAALVGRVLGHIG